MVAVCAQVLAFRPALIPISSNMIPIGVCLRGAPGGRLRAIEGVIETVGDCGTGEELPAPVLEGYHAKTASFCPASCNGNQHMLRFLITVLELKWMTTATFSDFCIHSSPLVRSTFCPSEIDHISGLTLYPVYWQVQESKIFTSQKLTLHAKRTYIREP